MTRAPAIVSSPDFMATNCQCHNTFTLHLVQAHLALHLIDLYNLQYWLDPISCLFIVDGLFFFHDSYQFDMNIRRVVAS